MDFTGFKKEVFRHFHLDLNGYKEKQLKRRIDHLMTSQGYSDYAAYYRALSTDKEQWHRFLDKLTINVSEFFRNPEVFKVLEEEILPSLLKRKKKLKIWSAACANGAEPYSIAIILDQLTGGEAHQIEATDVDEKVLREAQAGRYKAEAVKSVTPQRLARYFTRDGEFFQLSPSIKRRVTFRKHDLLLDNYGQNYDLIVCRNVTIYFTKETQNKIYRQFHQALQPRGILFIGATESILEYRALGFKKISSWFYQKA